MNFRYCVLPLCLFVCFACAGCSSLIKSESGNDFVSKRTEKKTSPARTGVVDLAQDLQEQSKSSPIIYMGTDTQIKLPQVQKPLQFVGDDVTLNFENFSRQICCRNSAWMKYL